VSSFLRIQDIADILIMSFLLYQLYSWFRRTRAMQVLLGLGVVTLIYFVTRFLGLYMTSWVLQELGTVLIVLVIVVFQSEIRQALYRFSHLRHIFYEHNDEGHGRFHEIAETMFSLAAKRTGVILVFQRSESLMDLALNGVPLDSEINPQILETIFTSGTPLHDGAALIRDGRLVLASCHLPLSVSADIPQYMGTRHRAAIGLSERTDAVVVVVSEERGTVSLAVAGEISPVKTAKELSDVLEKLINPEKDAAATPFRQKLFSNMLPKIMILLLVTSFWSLVTSRQGQITTVNAPVRMHGLPETLALVQRSPEEVEIQLKSYSILTPLPSKLGIVADIDLSEVREGHTTIRLKHSDFNLPSGTVISNITPASIKVVTDRKARKRVPVRPALKGQLPRALNGARIVIEPSSVEIEGPASQLEKITAVYTEEIDAARLTLDKEYQKGMVPPLHQVVVLWDDAVSLKVIKK